MDVLVLDVSYQPIDRVPWQEAICKWFKGLAEIVDSYEDREIRSVTLQMKMPSVIRLLKNIGKRNKAVKFSRENVYTRDKGKCQYCGCKVTRAEITYDHVVPRTAGGKTCWENVVISCQPCNQKKGGRTPQQAKMRLITEPVKPKSLPDTVRLTFCYQKGMPESWKSWLYDIRYWHSQLDQDE